MTPEEFLIELGMELCQQDNRITSNPLWQVQEQRKVWVGREHGEHSQWVDSSGEICDEDDSERVDEVFYTLRWQFVTAHLTERAAQRYIDENLHNLTNPRIFVSSQYRCHEFNELVEILKGMWRQAD